MRAFPAYTLQTVPKDLFAQIVAEIVPGRLGPEPFYHDVIMRSDLTPTGQRLLNRVKVAGKPADGLGWCGWVDDGPYHPYRMILPCEFAADLYDPYGMPLA